MIEIADVFRRFAADYVSAHGTSMLPSHRRAIDDILDCRTAALGGQVWRCDTCDTEMFCNRSHSPLPMTGGHRRGSRSPASRGTAGVARQAR